MAGKTDGRQMIRSGNDSSLSDYSIKLEQRCVRYTVVSGVAHHVSEWAEGSGNPTSSGAWVDDRFEKFHSTATDHLTVIMQQLGNHRSNIGIRRPFFGHFRP